MKQSIASVLTVFLFALVGLVGTASAAPGTIVKVDIPFEFSVGNKAYPAGHYSLAEIRQHIIALYDDSGRNIAMVLAYDVQPSLEGPAGSELKFDVVDGRRVLAEVWTGGESTGLAFPVKQVAPTQQASSGMSRHDASQGKSTQSN